jgi:MarR family transcriptional regulator, organic hydroperoxide resistance regulator
MDLNHDADDVAHSERRRISAEELSWSLRSLTQAAAELDHALAGKLGLRQLDYAAMGHVMSREASPLGPAELGHRLGISTGSATELVDRLERAGHLSRIRDDADRRRVSLVPREHAVTQIIGELRPLISSLDALATEFTPDEQDVINRYLRLATERMSDYAQELARSTSPIALDRAQSAKP